MKSNTSIKKDFIDQELNSIEFNINRAIDSLNSHRPNFSEIVYSIAEAGIISAETHNICENVSGNTSPETCHLYISEKISEINEKLVKRFEERCL